MHRYMTYRNRIPPPIRWAFVGVFAVPIMIVRSLFVGVILSLWVINAPKAVTLIWSGIAEVHASSKKRTPKKRAVLQSRKVHFDDVRTRISELTNGGR